MSNAEHLIENAIYGMKDGKEFDDFASDWRNKEMSQQSGINLHHVWEMAMYVVYTYSEKEV